MSFDSDLTAVQSAFRAAFKSSGLTIGELEPLRIQFLGRKGEIASLFLKISKISDENKPLFGKRINDLKQECQSLYDYATNAVLSEDSDGVEDAIEHINKHGTSHTDSIVTENKKTAKKFISNVKSSIAIHNASTQFADGGEFGFGAEVGISTNKLHPRGPVGLEQLTTYKYKLYGNGQIRK